MGTDVAIIVGGKVSQVHRGGLPARVPMGAIVVEAPAGRVHPGMRYNAATNHFEASAPPSAYAPQNRLGPLGTIVVEDVVVGSPMVSPAPPPVPSAGGSITINISNNGPPPESHLQSSPSSYPPASEEVPRVASPGFSSGTEVVAPSASSRPHDERAGPQFERDRARSALRSLQIEVWPPERERVADLAAVYVAYGNPADVPDLVALCPSGMTVADVASIALAARRQAQGWITSIGRMIAEDVPRIETSADADLLIASARALVE